MFNGNYSSVMSPCKDCPNRKLGCHSQCAKYSRYEVAKAEETIERVKSKEGIGGTVLRMSALVR